MDQDTIITQLQTVKDPEIGLDVYSLGLIYEISVSDTSSDVYLKMTYTTPFCPYGEQMKEDVRQAIKEAGAEDVEIEVTFSPPWQPPSDLRELLGV
ncbi:MAG: metal-sulfur cluster assembly factor [Candidatus Paceibacteria bacterium]